MFAGLNNGTEDFAMKRITSFVIDESGAVTVDLVVLIVAIVALGLAVGSAVISDDTVTEQVE